MVTNEISQDGGINMTKAFSNSKSSFIVGSIFGLTLISTALAQASQDGSTSSIDFNSRAAQIFNLQSLNPQSIETQLISGKSSPVVSAAGKSGSDLSAPMDSLQKKMILFEIDDGYNCPLFSHSPFVDALESIEGMQTQIQRMVPQCGSDQASIQRIQELQLASQRFRDRVIEAQKLNSSRSQIQTQGHRGETPQHVVRDLVLQANQLQKILSEAVASPASVCLQSNQEVRRHIIFQVNEAFQSLAPVVLNLVSQNPGLASLMGPMLRTVVGAESISRNISVFEQLIRESQMFDMRDSQSRINTIKNVCQFMKLYRRLSYLRISRLDEVQAVTMEYERDIQKLKLTAQTLQTNFDARSSLRKSSVKKELDDSFEQVEISSLPNLDAYLRMASTTNGTNFVLDQIKDALKYIENVKAKLSRPEASQCQIIKREFYRDETKQNFVAILQLARLFNQNQILRWADGVQVYTEQLSKLIPVAMKEAVVTEQQNLNECAVVGADWLISMAEIFESGKSLIQLFEDKLASENQMGLILQRKELARRVEAISQKQDELNQIKTLINVAAFESSEVDKNARGLYRFFLGGPNWSEISSESFLKKLAVWSVNEGPVYSLLKNTEASFLQAISETQKAIDRIQNFERPYSLVKFHNRIPTETQKFNAWYALDLEYKRSLVHINLENFPVGTARHKIICENAALAVDYYIQAANHLQSSEGLCRMVKPALKESEVSHALKSYCEVMPGSRWRNKSEDQISGIDRLKLRVVSGDLPIVSSIDQILKTMQNFECEKLK